MSDRVLGQSFHRPLHIRFCWPNSKQVYAKTNLQMTARLRETARAKIKPDNSYYRYLISRTCSLGTSEQPAKCYRDGKLSRLNRIGLNAKALCR